MPDDRLVPNYRSLLKDLGGMDAMTSMWTHGTTTVHDLKQYRDGTDCVVHLPLPGFAPDEVTATYHPDQAVLEVVGRHVEDNRHTSDTTVFTVPIPPRFMDQISIKVKDGQAVVTINGFYDQSEDAQMLKIPVEG